MEIRTILVDSHEKRWFGKVARAAEVAVNDLIEPIAGDEPIEIGAFFDTSESENVRIIDYREGTMSCTQVVFAARCWQTVTESIPQAIAQLACATTYLVPVELRSKLAPLLAEHMGLFPVHRSSRNVPGSGLTDFYLFLDEFMELEAFFALIDRIDRELTRRNVGQVTGNAYGVGAVGSCIDLEAAERDKAQEVAEAQIRASGIKRYRFES